ncbi:ras-related and estrogen-regulated growth inhibitor-like protein [Trichonephila clavipes]|nr:ras-related and estrogen-regulated growth inhibitor-like protein [Trichonephila clavipes]
MHVECLVTFSYRDLYTLIVRYLTKKYLHEYIRGELLTYDRRVTVDDKEYSLFFIDTPGTPRSRSLRLSSLWTTQESFERSSICFRDGCSECGKKGFSPNAKPSFMKANESLWLAGPSTLLKNTLANLAKQEIIENVDGYVVVYSITDRKSFMTSNEMLRSLHHGFEIVGYSPVCLIGNKLDLNHLT